MVLNETPPSYNTEQGNLPAVNLGKLKELAKDANLKSMKKQLFLMLRNEKVGTTKVEFKAMKMLEEGQCAKSRAARVLKKGRNPNKGENYLPQGRNLGNGTDQLETRAM